MLRPCLFLLSLYSTVLCFYQKYNWGGAVSLLVAALLFAHAIFQNLELSNLPIGDE